MPYGQRLDSYKQGQTVLLSGNRSGVVEEVPSNPKGAYKIRLWIGGTSHGRGHVHEDQVVRITADRILGLDPFTRCHR